MSVILWIFMFALVLLCLFLCLVILAQKSKSDGGMGAALGGGMAESAFGGETSDVLSKATIRGTVAFFVICFGLYLGKLYEHIHANAANGKLPTMSAPATPGSAKPAAAKTTAPASKSDASAAKPASNSDKSAPAKP